MSEPTIKHHFKVKLSADVLAFGVMYFLQPHLAKLLAPLQAQINAQAAAAGSTPAEHGLNAIANSLMQKLSTAPSA